MAVDSAAAYGPTRVTGWSARYELEIQRLTGGIPSAHTIYDEFSLKPYAAALTDKIWGARDTGTGTIANRDNVSGGVIRMDSGAVAANRVNLYGDPAVSPSLVAAAATEKWGVAFRFAIPTTIDAQAGCVLGMANIAVSRILGLGAVGAISTTKYAFFSSSYGVTLGNAGAASTVTIDTAFHNGVVFSTGAAWFGSIDGETPVSLPVGTFTGGGQVWMSVQNGTTAASQQVDIDSALYVFPGA